MNREFLLSELVKNRNENVGVLRKGMRNTRNRVIQCKTDIDDQFLNAHIGDAGLRKNQVLKEYSGEYCDDINIHKLEDVNGRLLGRGVSTDLGLVTAWHVLSDVPPTETVVELLVDDKPYVGAYRLVSKMWDLSILSHCQKTKYETGPVVGGVPCSAEVFGRRISFMPEFLHYSNHIFFDNSVVGMGPGFSGTPIFQLGRVVAIYVGTQQEGTVGVATVVATSATAPSLVPLNVNLCKPKPRYTNSGVEQESDARKRIEKRFDDIEAQYEDLRSDYSIENEYDQYEYDYGQEDFAIDNDSSSDSGYSHDSYGRNVKNTPRYLYDTHGKNKNKKKEEPAEIVVLASTVASVDLNHAVVTQESGEESKLAEDDVVSPPALTRFAPQVVGDASEDDSDDSDIPPPPPPLVKEKPIWRKVEKPGMPPYWYHRESRETTWIDPTTVPEPTMTAKQIKNLPKPDVTTTISVGTTGKKDLAAMKLEKDIADLQADIKNFEDQGTMLTQIVTLTDDEKKLYPAKLWTFHTLNKKRKLLAKKHAYLQQERARREASRRELARTELLLQKYNEEVAKLQAKIEELKESVSDKSDF